MIAAAFLILLAAYFGCGFAFAIPFVLIGAKRIDPHATKSSWGFRILIFPGTVALWPLLFFRWASGWEHPPEERSAHRLLASQTAK